MGEQNSTAQEPVLGTYWGTSPVFTEGGLRAWPTGCLTFLWSLLLRTHAPCSPTGNC